MFADDAASVHPLQQPSSQLGGQVSSPLSAQILEFCESDILFPDENTLQDSEVASTSNGGCYEEDHSSYYIPAAPDDVPAAATDLIIHNHPITNNNFSILFDDQEISHDHHHNVDDIDSVNLDCLTTSSNFEAYRLFEAQDELSVFENDPHQMQILQTTTDCCNLPIPHPNDHVVPDIFGQTTTAPALLLPNNVYQQHDFLSSSNMPPSKLMRFNNHHHHPSSSPAANYYSYLSTNSNPPLPLEDLGIFNANLLFLGDNTTGGIFCPPDTLPRPYNNATTTNYQLQEAADEDVVNKNNNKGGGGGSCSPPPLASEITSLEADTSSCYTSLTSNKLTAEERKQKINRYMNKRNHRNFTKKIKYACRKTLADSRPRVRGRFAKNDEFGDHHHNINNNTTTCCSNHEEDTDEDVKSYHMHVVVKEEEEMNHESPSSDIFAHISGLNSFKCNTTTNNYPIQSWI